MKVYQIPTNQIGKRPVGQIKGKYRDITYSNVVKGYVGGKIPVEIETNMTQAEWERFCDGKLTEADIKSLKNRGVF